MQPRCADRRQGEAASDEVGDGGRAGSAVRRWQESAARLLCESEQRVADKLCTSWLRITRAHAASPGASTGASTSNWCAHGAELERQARCDSGTRHAVGQGQPEPEGKGQRGRQRAAAGEGAGTGSGLFCGERWRRSMQRGTARRSGAQSLRLRRSSSIALSAVHRKDVHAPRPHGRGLRSAHGEFAMDELMNGRRTCTTRTSGCGVCTTDASARTASTIHDVCFWLYTGRRRQRLPAFRRVLPDGRPAWSGSRTTRAWSGASTVASNRVSTLRDTLDLT